VLARFGGEEFVVLLRDAGLDESSATAERIRTEIASLSNLPGDLSLTASIGVAIGSASESAATFLLRSDEALYRAKRSGRNLVSIHPSCSTQPVTVV
jgi:diguanylate cyclase (GGDEF)-like protein